MTGRGEEPWTKAAEVACYNAPLAIACPACRVGALRSEWNVISATSREADVDLKCEACSCARRVRIVLPPQAPDFYPLTRLACPSGAILQEFSEILERLRKHEKVFPAATWMLNPLWLISGWSATTFRWHPTSEAPPIMGLVFENAEVAKELFRSWTAHWGNTDELEEIRIAIIEGDMPGQQPGYSVHVCPDPESALVRATAEGVVVKDIPFGAMGQVRRMHQPADQPALLPRFKEEFAKHQQFLFAPVTRREDGQLYCDVELGIEKSVVHFRTTAVIKAGDIDEVVFRAPITMPAPMTLES